MQGKVAKGRKRLLDPTPLKVQAALGQIADDVEAEHILTEVVNGHKPAERSRKAGNLRYQVRKVIMSQLKSLSPLDLHFVYTA